MKANPKRIEAARLGADMSRADLAAALRRVTSGRLKASERGIRGWEKGEYAPSDGVIPAYALATGRPLDFFYADGDGADESEEESAPMSREAEALLDSMSFEELLAYKARQVALDAVAKAVKA